MMEKSQQQQQSAPTTTTSTDTLTPTSKMTYQAAHDKVYQECMREIRDLEKDNTKDEEALSKMSSTLAKVNANDVNANPQLKSLQKTADELHRAIRQRRAKIERLRQQQQDLTASPATPPSAADAAAGSQTASAPPAQRQCQSPPQQPPTASQTNARLKLQRLIDKPNRTPEQDREMLDAVASEVNEQRMSRERSKKRLEQMQQHARQEFKHFHRQQHVEKRELEQFETELTEAKQSWHKRLDLIKTKLEQDVNGVTDSVADMEQRLHEHNTNINSLRATVETLEQEVRACQADSLDNWLRRLKYNAASHSIRWAAGAYDNAVAFCRWITGQPPPPTVFPPASDDATQVDTESDGQTVDNRPDEQHTPYKRNKQKKKSRRRKDASSS